MLRLRHLSQQRVMRIPPPPFVVAKVFLQSPPLALGKLTTAVDIYAYSLLSYVCTRISVVGSTAPLLFDVQIATS